MHDTKTCHIHALERAIKRTLVTSLSGPRQCGKTTLARILEKKFDAAFFDLESSQDLQRLQNPELILGSIERHATYRSLNKSVFINRLNFSPNINGF